MLTQYLTESLVLAEIGAVIGCIVQYADLFKKNKFSWPFFIVDLITALLLGFVAYYALVQDLGLTDINGMLVNFCIGNMGSKALSLFKAVVYSKLETMFPGFTRFMFGDNPNTYGSGYGSYNDYGGYQNYPQDSNEPKYYDDGNDIGSNDQEDFK